MFRFRDSLTSVGSIFHEFTTLDEKKFCLTSVLDRKTISSDELCSVDIAPMHFKAGFIKQRTVYAQVPTAYYCFLFIIM